MTNRYILPLLLFLFCTLNVHAKIIDETTARGFAETVLSNQSPYSRPQTKSSLSSGLTLTKVEFPFREAKKTSLTKSTLSTYFEPFYIFNSSGGGFAIIAGDDSVEPILGYCDKGSFETENMPDNIRWWFDMWAEQIQINVNRNYQPGSKISDQWESLESGVRSASSESSSKLLETALWNQGAPYNNLCPSFGGERSITGCVATSTAIVMRYFKHPLQGNGTLPDYSYTIFKETRKISGHTLTAVYDWDNMPLEYKGSETTAQKNAVARLMYDVGVMCQMNYDPSCSSTYSEYIPAGLKQYMGYDKSCNIYNYNDFPQNEWLALMKSTINETGPFCYGGQGKKGGHEFVIDGYDAERKFHINWGWGGLDNGYYTIGAFQDFKELQDMIVIKPEAGGKDSRYLSIYAMNGYYGMSCETSTFSQGVSFKGNCTYIANTLMEDYSGYIGVGRISKTGEIKEVQAQNQVTLPMGNCAKLSFNIAFSSIEIGDYMTIVSKVSGSDTWIPAKYDLTDKNLVGVIPLVKSLEDETSLKYTVSTGLLLVSTEINVQWTFKTEGGADASSAASWSETTGTLTIDTNQLEAGKYVLVLSKGSESKTLNFTF